MNFEESQDIKKISVDGTMLSQEVYDIPRVGVCVDGKI